MILTAEENCFMKIVWDGNLNYYLYYYTTDDEILFSTSTSKEKPTQEQE